MRRYGIVEWGFLLVLLTAVLVGTPLAHATGPADSPPDTRLYEYPDALIVPAGAQGVTPGDADDQDFYYPSAYMAGSVAVQILLPESNGSADSTSEDWQPAQVDAVTRAVGDALGWWQKRTPGAGLRFVIETKVVSSTYEPIAHALDDENVWIGELLRQLGYVQPGYFAQAFAAADALREAKGTNWALTIFVVNSANDADGRFADKRFAYAYIGGPFLVVTSDAGPYGSANLAPVLAHEIGHLFGALDQYASARVSCEQRGGYLNVPTLNSRYGSCPSQLPSIMYDPLPAFAAGEIDPYALGQVGYRDSDGDGLIDVLDTMPVLELKPSSPTEPGQQPCLSGRAVDQPYPSASSGALDINTIDRFEYRIGSGNWQLAVPDAIAADGSFTLTLPLYDGQHNVGLRVVNSAGVASSVMARSLTVQGLGLAPTLMAQVPAFVNGATVPVRLDGPAQSVQLSMSPTFAGATWQPMAGQVSFDLEATAEQTYPLYTRFRSSGGAVSPVYALSTTLDLTPPSGLVRRLPNNTLLASAEDLSSGVAEMQIATNPQIATEGWRPFEPSINLPSDATLIGIRFRDRAGNVSPLYQLATTSSSIALPIIVRP